MRKIMFVVSVMTLLGFCSSAMAASVGGLTLGRGETDKTPTVQEIENKIKELDTQIAEQKNVVSFHKREIYMLNQNIKNLEKPYVSSTASNATGITHAITKNIPPSVSDKIDSIKSDIDTERSKLKLAENTLLSMKNRRTGYALRKTLQPVKKLSLIFPIIK